MHLYERPRGQYRGLAFAAVVFALLAAVFLLRLLQRRSAVKRARPRW